MNKVLIALSALTVITLAGVASCAPQIPELLTALGPKNGRIIDADSGVGIAGVVVIEESWFVEEGLLNRSAGCTSIEMTRTDDSGNYHFPNSYYGWELGFPLRHPRQRFFLYTSKPNYIDATTKWPLVHDRVGDIQEDVEIWNSSSFDLKMDGLDVEIPLIQMRRVDLSLEDQALYFFFSGLMKTCPNSPKSMRPMQDAMHEFYRTMTDKICSGNDEDLVPRSLIQSVSIYAPNVNAVGGAVNKLDRDHHILPQTKDGMYPRDEACAALRTGTKI